MAAFPTFSGVTSVRRPNDSAKTVVEMSAAACLFVVRSDTGGGFGHSSMAHVTPVSHVCNMLHALTS